MNTEEKNMLVSGLFKIVCATCPAHAVVHEWVRYQDGLLIHYECHGEQHLAAMYSYFERALAFKNHGRCRYAFNVVKPDVSCLPEPIDCVHVLDTELTSLDQAEVIKMRGHLGDGLALVDPDLVPAGYTKDDWAQTIAGGQKTLALLNRFAGGPT